MMSVSNQQNYQGYGGPKGVSPQEGEREGFVIQSKGPLKNRTKMFAIKRLTLM